MVIKIFFNDKPLFLCDEITAELQDFMHHDDAVYIDELSSPALNSMIYEMQLEKIHAGIYFSKDLGALKKAFWKKFFVIIAGGGLIVNDRQQYLMIFRRGKWDLPKGKLDPGETIEACALREVREETGLAQVDLIQNLLVTYHTYKENGKHVLKESHWFNMQAHGEEQLVPQTAEDIAEVRWVKAEDISSLLQNAFPSVIDVIKTKLQTI